MRSGLLLLLPDDLPFLRLQLAVLLSTAFLLLGAWARPFKRPMHTHFYLLASLAYVVIFLAMLGVYLIQEIKEYASEATVQVVIGVTAGDGFISLVLAFAAVVVFVAASMTSYPANCRMSAVVVRRNWLSSTMRIFLAMVRCAVGSGESVPRKVSRQDRSAPPLFIPAPTARGGGLNSRPTHPAPAS